MKKVLITGASGLLGKAIIRELLEDDQYEILAVTTNKNRLEQFSNIEIIETNLLMSESCRQIFVQYKPEYMIHLAWDQSKSTFRNDKTNIDWLIVSLNLLQEFAKCGGRRLVFAGTSSEYDEYSGKMEETYVEHKMTVYGQCKKAFSEVAINYGETFGIDVAITRYFTIYGEEDEHEFGAIPFTITSFLKGEKVVCRAPNTIRDYIYVKDAAAATIKILKSDYKGIVNVGSGIPHRMKDVFSIIADKMNCNDLLSFENENCVGDILVADTKIMNKIMGYNCKYTFQKGIDEVIKYRKDKSNVR